MSLLACLLLVIALGGCGSAEDVLESGSPKSTELAVAGSEVSEKGHRASSSKPVSEETPSEPAPEQTPAKPAEEPAPAPDSTASSEPFVTSVVLENGVLSISGSRFGSGRVMPLLWDDFEAGASGAQIAAAPRVGNWRPVYAERSVYTSAQKHSGSKSLYAARTPSSQWANFDLDLPSGITTLYQGFWFRYNYPAGARGQSKLAQVWGTYRVGDHNPGMLTGGMAGDWWATYIALENSGTYRRGNYPEEPAQNTWHHYEAIFKQSDPNVANGSITIKIDGRVVYQHDPVKTRERTGEEWNMLTFFTGMTNFGGPSATWIDDVYASDSWARVVLCDSPVYTDCAGKEIQLLLSWNDSAITARMNKGGFARGQMAYLFVVNSRGITNPQGYPVAIE